MVSLLYAAKPVRDEDNKPPGLLKCAIAPMANLRKNSQSGFYMHLLQN
jgi:hypothetical protein